MGRQFFLGFETGEEGGKGRLKHIQLRPDPARPAVHKLYDVLALPGEAALYTCDGHPIEESRTFTLSPQAPHPLLAKFQSKAPKQINPPRDTKVVNGAVLFAGYLTSHYGHFLIDSMSRLWARDVFSSLPILFTTPLPHQELPDFGRDILDALELSSRVLRVDEPTIFREVICPGTAFEYRWKAFSVADEPHLRAAKTVRAGKIWRRPVYFTRRAMPDLLPTDGKPIRQVRKANGESELEAELVKRGVEVVIPEALSLSEQIAIFRTAPLVIGTTGSAFHTALFSNSSDLCLAILNWGKGSENHMLVDGLKKHTSYYLKGMRSDPATGEVSLDVEVSLRLLEQAGLTATRTHHICSSIGKGGELAS